MRILLITIGLLLMIGGTVAIKRTQSIVNVSSGPDASNDQARPILDAVSKERSKTTGYVVLILGFGICVTGFFAKNPKVPEPHDTSA